MPQTLQEFIKAHRTDDVRQLALQAHRYPEVDMKAAVTQIDGWQRARTKLPSWAAHADIIYPPHLAIEQCSSETTARYKASLCRRLLDEYPSQAETAHQPGTTSMADLTGGMGVDFAFLAPLFDTAHYIERQSHLCQTARHNFQVLGLRQADVTEGDGLDVLTTLPHQRLLFIDPARRNTAGARTFAISDCTPDIMPALPMMLDKADLVMVKLSPMLDWHQTAASMQAAHPGSVREIHIVATANECKELLVVLSASHTDRPTTLHCANDGSRFDTDTEAEARSGRCPTIGDFSDLETATWLYEPDVTIMKAGCFATLAQRFPIRALAPNSHLFVADTLLTDFPGRKLPIRRVATTNKRQLSEALKGIGRANITVRNFPMTADQLRRRLHLADGGCHWIFASTIGHHDHVIIICDT